MQQVVSALDDPAPHPSLQIVEPNRLPVLLRAASRNALVRAGHAWVLHRRVIVLGIAAAAAITVAAIAIHFKDVLAGVGETLVQAVQGEFAAVGFGIEGIDITGHSLSSDRHIGALLSLTASPSTLGFDAQKASARLNWLRAVDTATVRKIYPNRILVEIVEKVPVARWRVGTQTWLVDAEGTRVGEAQGMDFVELPLVVGPGAADDALVMVRALERHSALKSNLAAISRIGDRRWDLIYYTGLRVRLPEAGVAQALAALDGYQRDYALLDRDVTLIDLRVPGMVSVKPTVREGGDGETTQ